MYKGEKALLELLIKYHFSSLRAKHVKFIFKVKIYIWLFKHWKSRQIKRKLSHQNLLRHPVGEWKGSVESLLRELPCIFSGIIKNFRYDFSCINSPDKNLVNGLKMSPSLQLLLVLLAITLLVGETEGNLRCYSCAPCNELELYAGDVTHFEQDCYLDRYCMKVSRE